MCWLLAPITVAVWRRRRRTKELGCGPIRRLTRPTGSRVTQTALPEIPAEANEEDTSSPDHVIGDGTPESCTSAAVVDAVAQGGVITFDCGDDPLTIKLESDREDRE